MADYAGRFDLGGGIDDTSDGTLRSQFAPLPAAGIDTLQRRALVAAAMLVEIPIRDSIHRRDDAGMRPEQGLHRLDRPGDGMRLQADDDEILMPEFGGIIGAAWPHDAFFVADQEFEAVGAHGGEMGAARDQADIGARAGQLYAEISADRAGAVDANFHASPE